MGDSLTEASFFSKYFEDPDNPVVGPVFLQETTVFCAPRNSRQLEEVGSHLN